MTSHPSTAATPRLPSIHLTAEDHSLLSALVGDLDGDGPAALLQQELSRARINGGRPRAATVGLNRWVHYTDGHSHQTRRVKIVLPEQADIDQGLISPLSYVGAGLLGLAEGQSILWPDPSGRLRKLTPILIEDPDDLV